MNMNIHILHLFPDLLNLYGDRGNIICMRKRLEWRGIDVSVNECKLADSLRIEDADIIFLGGGSDREQRIVAGRLLEHRNDLLSYVNDGGVLVAICGGFQLIGYYYQVGEERIEGLSLVDAYTISGEKRLVGNVVLEACFSDSPQTIVGFENHGGRTYIGDHMPLGRVVSGYGNNGEDQSEGIIHNNIVGTYLHGPLFPKNPMLADYVLLMALRRKYGTDAKLANLNDLAENRAHEYAASRFCKGNALG